MKKVLKEIALAFLSVFLLTIISCQNKNSSSNTPSDATLNAINLKRGEVVSCGATDKQFGNLAFGTSCSENVKKDINLAIAILHSFEYDEAEKAFAKIIDEEPECAIAYWGVAMSNFHQLWSPPSVEELEKGAKAIAVAQSLTQKSKRESAYIEAMALFYQDWQKTDHRTRSIKFEKAMEKVYMQYPDDKEAAIFYALSLNGAADPTDKSFSKQKKAGEILKALYPGNPDHPGLIHYIIHSYDYPELASLALPAARKYASIAPSSAHAQHMPSHIFTRLGLWDEDIKSNLASAESAKCYAEKTGIKGHWDEELHALDYLVYAYLQKADNTLAKKQVDYLKTIQKVSPQNFKVAYSFAAIPSRYLLENKMWKEAASLEFHPKNFPWEKYPWQKAIVHFTRLLGSVHTGNLSSAKTELITLNSIHDTLLKQKDSYKANQVQIQMKTAEAWILFKEGKNNEALNLMETAANMEDNTQKHPVTPGEVLPARELLGDMLMQMNKHGKALEAYEADLKKHANRFNGLYAAGLAAEKSGNLEKATSFYRKLVDISDPINSNRRELETAKLFLKKQAISLRKDNQLKDL